MFYSAELLAVKNHNGLGVVWLAATLGSKSNAKKLNRRDFSNVNIIETCKFLESPPEPMSLRLSSNLMVGVSRIYGQLWNCYYGDVSSLLTDMNCFRASKTVDMAVKKAQLEDITLGKTNDAANLDEDPLKMLYLEGLDLDAFDAFNFQANRTPEQVRRSMTSASSATRGNQSIDIGRGASSSNIFDPRGTSLSGAESIIGTQFGANENDMTYYGMDDDFGFMPSGPESLSNGDIGSFIRSSGKRDSAINGVVLDQIPTEIQAKSEQQKKKYASATMIRKMFDEETLLGKEELLLEAEEGLLPFVDGNEQNDDFESFIEGSLAGIGCSSLFTVPTMKNQKLPLGPSRNRISSSGLSSEHNVPMMDDEYGFMMLDHTFEADSTGASIEAPFGSGRASSLASIKLEIPDTLVVQEALRRVSDYSAKGKKDANCDFAKLLEGKPANRSSASKMFYNVLFMACRGDIRVQQEKPFGPINIHN